MHFVKKIFKVNLCYFMAIPSKYQILKRFNALFQTKPDHMRLSLSQLLLDLLSLQVATPVVIPAGKQPAPQS